MSCDNEHCEGYIIEHSEGATCDKCHRLQSFSEGIIRKFDNSQFICDDISCHELCYFVDSNIISNQCASHALSLFRSVRKMRINYIHHELVALVLSQAVFDTYQLVIFLTQICAILKIHIDENSFQKKYLYLVKRAPKLFAFPPHNVPPLALSLLNLKPKTSQKIQFLTGQLLSNSGFTSSYRAALYCVLQNESNNGSDDMLHYICGYPEKYDVLRCRISSKSPSTT